MVAAAATPDCLGQRGVANFGYDCQVVGVDGSSAEATCTGISVWYDPRSPYPYSYEIAGSSYQDMSFSFICVD